MLNRLKAALVNSYVGAIATGWLLGEGLYSLAGVLTRPIELWYLARFYHQLIPSEISVPSHGLSIAGALTDLLGAVVRLLIAFLLLRWLYWERPSQQAGTKVEEPEASA
jgi:hypothetical protein